MWASDPINLLKEDEHEIQDKWPFAYVVSLHSGRGKCVIRGCIQKFPDWPPG
jgi:hypothetical protein